ncbi:hypothetical protein ACFPFQ_44600 [Pseudonocardia sp. GCM10023141]
MGRTVRRTTALLIGVLLVAATTAGCTVAVSGQAKAPRGAAPLPVTGPPDRDPAAVLPALRQIDPCGLLDLDHARAQFEPGSGYLPRGPHGCAITPVPTQRYSPEFSPYLEVEIGVKSDRFARLRFKPVTLAGARGYESLDPNDSKGCEFQLPVSQRYAISLKGTAGGGQPCDVLRPYAEFAAKALQSPDALPANARAYGKWDGCFLVAATLGEAGKDYDYEPNGIYDEFSGCSTSLRDSADSGPRMNLRYDVALTAKETTGTLAGHPVERTTGTKYCSYKWVQGSSGVDNKWVGAAVIQMTGNDCETVEKSAAQVMAQIEQAPPASTVALQRPLLYGPDDNDTGALGACADFSASNAGDDCTPYDGKLVVSGTPQDILTAGDKDRNMQCAVFQDALKAHLGADLTPISWGAHCFFVQPSHALQVQVNLSASFPAGDYGKNNGPDAEQQTTEFGGKPAITFYGGQRSSYDIYLSPAGDLAAKGHLHIRLEPGAVRGAPVGGAGRVPVTPEQAAAAGQVMTDVVQRYFT